MRDLHWFWLWLGAVRHMVSLGHNELLLQGLLLLIHRSTEIRAWISNHIHDFLWDVITYKCNSSLTKPPLKLGHSEWVIDPSHKSYNASGKYHAMHHFVIHIFCYISVTKMMHCGILDWCIVGFVQRVYYIPQKTMLWLLIHVLI